MLLGKRQKEMQELGNEPKLKGEKFKWPLAPTKGQPFGLGPPR